MDRRPQPRNTVTLCGAVVLAVTCGVALHAWPTLTGSAILDGSIGVIVGLYTCSHPAANAVDFLFASRGGVRQVAAQWSGLGWLALNALTLLVGWLVIVVGAVRFVG